VRTAEERLEYRSAGELTVVRWPPGDAAVGPNAVIFALKSRKRLSEGSPTALESGR